MIDTWIKYAGIKLVELYSFGYENTNIHKRYFHDSDHYIFFHVYQEQYKSH